MTSTGRQWSSKPIRRRATSPERRPLQNSPFVALRLERTAIHANRHGVCGRIDKLGSLTRALWGTEDPLVTRLLSPGSTAVESRRRDLGPVSDDECATASASPE